MSDPTPIADEPVHHYDPLTDEGRTGRKTNRFLIALIIAGIVHLALFGYIYRLKIIAKFKDYSDQATKVELRKAAPPPPPRSGRPAANHSPECNTADGAKPHPPLDALHSKLSTAKLKGA